MKKIIFLSAFILIVSSISAQQKLEIADIEMTNLGDTQLYATKRDSDKTPLEGKIRIITGFTTEYIDAEFKGGYGIGKWEYYKNNKLTVTINYKDGYRDGDFSELYSSGDIKEKGKYLKGQKNGTWETFKSDGIIKSTEIFDNGSVTKRITYYTDGKVDSERNYKNGKEDGITKQYTWEGVLKSEKNYINGKQVGKQMQYYTSNAGDYIQTSNYDENGKLSGDFLEIYADNKATKEKGKYLNGNKAGKWIYGYKNHLYKEETYENGKLTDSKELK